ncbi:hypothetical protein DFH08DRAFT_339253 [Mycena albidolilacea]|uniref:F-box domain-containing protein n=1 Tax=Mycena albidolilacea TaxID=1033008 RepID=A0AAD6ZK46_9AGAR|nr:hypothetical protein DFH08DRAFT_339253 [Mycena albidolilacea]
MDPWMQSLRADSSRTRRDGNVTLNNPRPSSKLLPLPTGTKRSLVAPASAVRPRTTVASNGNLNGKFGRTSSSKLPPPVTKGPDVAPAAVRPHTMLASNQNPNGKFKVSDGIFVFVTKHLVEENAGAGKLAPDSLGTKIPVVEKCPNLCCAESLSRPNEFVQSRAEAISECRMMYPVDASEAAHIMDQISPVESLYTSCEMVLARLKSMLAARQPQQVLAVSGSLNPCTHACCQPSFYPPPRASPEWPRLRRITQQLQLRCQEMSQYLSAKRYLLAPVRRLPPELLQEVFLFTVISNTYALTASSPPRRSRNAASLRKALDAIRLAHVCSYWRAVALNAAQLWALILLRLSDRSGIAQLHFHIKHAKLAPLTIICHEWAGWKVLRDLARQSHHWRNITLRIKSYFQELDVVRSRVTLLRSLCIKTCELDAGRTINIFQDAPSLRHVSLTVSRNDFWPFSFILPWHQVTSLTLDCIPFPAFSRCLQECPRLLYFNVQISWRQAVETVWHITHPCLRKLVMHGSRCQSAIFVHSFPHLLSLRIEMEGKLHPGFFAFLAQCSHLEMFLVHSWHFTREDWGLRSQLSVELLVATPSLRILRFRNWQEDWYTTIVTSRFWTTAPFAPLLDDSFTPVAPQLLPKLHVEDCTVLGDVKLLALIQARMEHDPSFDPYGIDKARLEIQNVPFDPEAELDYLDHLL